uniref:Atp6 n=1 Tax=Calcarina hispida TaxID=203399 RepID=UPI0023F32617|nr:Atp6 [Calcarina hispida]WEF49986.1 Atp6 [Calcarina hispida]
MIFFSFFITSLFIYPFFIYPLFILLYSEQYFSFTIDMVNSVLQLISVWKKVPLSSLLYYLLLATGYSITMVSIKLFITVSMMIANIIDIYLSGIMIVLINWLVYNWYFGWIVSSYLLYVFLTRIEVFLIVSFMLEAFSIISQSLTLSNRLSINILAGSLLISSLSVAIIITSPYLIICSLIFIIYLLIYSFEILNSLVQLFIFNLLSIEYLLLHAHIYYFSIIY